MGYSYVLGMFKNFRNNDFESSIEVYYKDLKNQIDYIDGADLLINKYFEGDLLSGIGRAYGVEFLLKKNSGDFNGNDLKRVYFSEKYRSGRESTSKDLELTTFPYYFV